MEQNNNNNMMPNGMMGGMQRPQQGNASQQMYANIINELKKGMDRFVGGWQQAHSIGDRATRIMQLISQLRLINADTNMCLGIAQKWEVRTFEESQNKDQYVERMEQKLNEIRQRRTQQAGNIPLGVNGMMPGNQMPNNGMMRPGNMMAGLPNMGNMANMQNMGNMNGMNGMNGMTGMNGGMNGMNGMNAMGFPNNQMNGQNAMFPAQLARPMQPSSVNMPGQAGTLDPSALQMSRQQSQQQQQQTQQQQQQNAMNQAGQQQTTNMAQGGQGGQAQAFQNMIGAAARRMLENMSEEQRKGMRQKLFDSMPQQQAQMLQQKGVDPLLQFCLKKAQEQIAKQRMNQQNANMQMGNNGPQRPASQTGGQNFDVSGILGQQANALKLQDAGEQVVPASNNNSNNFNMGLGNNQMNQGINPQMLNNQGATGGQSGNNAISQQQAAFLNAQRNEQQRERAQKQMAAQNHALQAARMQQSQLTGQPGGLHAGNAFNGAAAPSPAMSMLNRPMAPPGQVTPGTPQPGRQQPMPQTPMNGANQLMQHHQNMVNQNNQLHNQQSQQLMPPNALHALLNRVPAEYRAKLAQMPPQQMQAMLAKLGAASKQPNGPGQSGQMNQPGMPMQGGPPNSNMLQQMGNVNPGFNPQPPANQPNMQITPQALAQRNNQMQMARVRQNIMDSKPFPRNALTVLNISVPPHIQKWGELKQHIAQNSSVMPPQTQERLQQMQQHWYQTHPEEINTTMSALLQQRQQQGQNAQNAQMLNNMQQPGMTAGSQAPPAQMVPPAPLMQVPQANVTPGNNQSQHHAVLANIMRQITPEDIQKWRMSVRPRADGFTDEQARQLMAQQRLERLRHASMQQGQRQPNQTPQIPRPQPGNMPNGGQAPQRLPQPGQPPAAVNQKPPQQGNDDVIEISNPAIQQQPPQAPPMQPTHSQQRVPTQEQIAQMTPQQRALWAQKRQQMEALRKANAGGNTINGMPAPGPNSQQILGQKIGNMMREIQAVTQKGQPVNLDAEGHERVRSSLARLWKPVMSMQQTFPLAMTWGMEQQLRNIIRTMFIVKMNAKDDQGTPNGFYALTQQHLQEMERTVATYMSDFKNMQLRMQAQKGAASKDQQPAAPSMVHAPLQQGHSRKPSNVKAPPAPTDEKKFDWTAQSPGVPTYATDQPGLTQDKLKFPPRKKTKPNQTGSQVSTPAGQAGTPATAGASPAIGSGKVAQSPEQARKIQQQRQAEAEREAEARKFRCKDNACEHSLHGFDTVAELEDHDKAEHQPVENALEFLLANATTALEVDEQGNSIAKAVVPNPKVASAAAPPATKPRLTVKDLPPNELTKQEAELLKKNTIPASVKQKLAKKQAEIDSQGTKEKEAEKEQTMREVISQKLNIPASTVEPTMPKVEVQDEEMFDLGLASYDADGVDLFGFDSNQLTYDNIEEMARMGSAWEPIGGDLSAWRLSDDPDLTDSSPERTPSAGSQSSHASDVSQSDTMRFIMSCENDAWDPFGTGDCGIAESMMPLYTKIKDMMADGSNEGESGSSPKKRKAVEELWDAPVRDFLDNDFFGVSKGN